MLALHHRKAHNMS